ncbi:hypothetical protein LCGC14_0268010 [marine sediment metagenome]|uniref:Uncharacterized protein n=1 Tax=marine sediment metagenome TaxID=412755 RepID=A0A0F9U065_9ZZZZ
MPRSKLKYDDIIRIKRFCASHPTRITVSEILNDLIKLYPRFYPTLLPGTPEYKIGEPDNYKTAIRKLLKKFEVEGYLKRQEERVYDPIGILQKERTRFIWYLPDKTPDIRVTIPFDEFKLMVRVVCETGKELDAIILIANSNILLGNKDLREWKVTLTEEVRIVLMQPEYSDTFEQTLKRLLDRLDNMFQEIKELQ